MQSSARKPVQHRSTIGTLMLMVVGPTVWALHLGVLYGYQSVACEVSSRGVLGVASVLPVIVLATLAAGLSLTLFFLFFETFERVLGAANWGPSQSRFQRTVALCLTALSLFGILGAGAASGFLGPCVDLG